MLVKSLHLKLSIRIRILTQKKLLYRFVGKNRRFLPFRRFRRNNRKYTNKRNRSNKKNKRNKYNKKAKLRFRKKFTGLNLRRILRKRPIKKIIQNRIKRPPLIDV